MKNSRRLSFTMLFTVPFKPEMVFYDAFLVDATTEERYDKVSSHGYAWGYIGSCIPFIACLAVVLGGSSFGIDAKLGMKIAFIITAVWWVIFTVPVAKNV